ncbi:hypothetical protein DFH09DRAFT_1288804 [Mycena vulgaris]|nr:hypothetical protein DFH09DRAFT_1288804 [Mycena vulgaris]
MFILSTHALDLLAAPPRLRLFLAATLALTLLAVLLVLAGVRAAVAARRRLTLPLSAKAIQVQVQEKSTPKTAPKPASSWPPLRLSWETLPPPPASSPQPHVPRAGPVRRPEPALVSRPRAEAPHLPPPLPLPLPRLGLLAAPPHASCERERMSSSVRCVACHGERVANESMSVPLGSVPTARMPRSYSAPASRSPHAASSPCTADDLAHAPHRRPSRARRRSSTYARPQCGSVAFSHSRGCCSVASARIGVGGRCRGAASFLSDAERRDDWKDRAYK